eukprot:1966257-Rhodomonas_salina.1
MPQGFSLNPDSLPEQGTPDSEDVAEMRALLGSLMYLQVWMRPEISYAVNYLASYTHRACPSTILAAKRVL